MSERRYSDDEMREIFGAAAEAEAHGEVHGEAQGLAQPDGGSGADALAPATGMSLAELQDIGAEVGLSATAIAAAARRLESPDRATGVQVASPGAGALARLDATRRMPLTVAASGALAGPISDEQWHELVARLRATFNATGTIQQSGPLRTWRNGNLQVHVEPAGPASRFDAEGREGREGPAWQVRLFTRSGQYSQGGLIGSMSGVGGGLLALIGQPEGGIFLAGAGLATLAWSFVGSRAWSRLREAQFRDVVAWTQRLAESGRDDER